MLRMHKWTLRTRVIAQIHGDVVITCIKKLTLPTAYFNSSSLAEQPKVILHGILFTYAVLKVCMSSFFKKITKFQDALHLGFSWYHVNGELFFFLCKLIGLNIQTL